MSHVPGHRIDQIPKVREFWADSLEHRRELARAVNTLLRGGTNRSLSFTLAPDDTETVLMDPEFNAQTTLLIHPLTASAAAATGMWFEMKQGEVVIHHDAQPAPDRNFRGVFFG